MNSCIEKYIPETLREMPICKEYFGCGKCFIELPVGLAFRYVNQWVLLISEAPKFPYWDTEKKEIAVKTIQEFIESMESYLRKAEERYKEVGNLRIYLRNLKQQIEYLERLKISGKDRNMIDYLEQDIENQIKKINPTEVQDKEPGIYYFQYLVFYPFFSRFAKEQNRIEDNKLACRFLKSVYWTHACKTNVEIFWQLKNRRKYFEAYQEMFKENEITILGVKITDLCEIPCKLNLKNLIVYYCMGKSLKSKREFGNETLKNTISLIIIASRYPIEYFSKNCESRIRDCIVGQLLLKKLNIHLSISEISSIRGQIDNLVNKMNDIDLSWIKEFYEDNVDPREKAKNALRSLIKFLDGISRYFKEDTKIFIFFNPSPRGEQRKRWKKYLRHGGISIILEIYDTIENKLRKKL